MFWGQKRSVSRSTTVLVLYGTSKIEDAPRETERHLLLMKVQKRATAGAPRPGSESVCSHSSHTRYFTLQPLKCVSFTEGPTGTRQRLSDPEDPQDPPISTLLSPVEPVSCCYGVLGDEARPRGSQSIKEIDVGKSLTERKTAR